MLGGYAYTCALAGVLSCALEADDYTRESAGNPRKRLPLMRLGAILRAMKLRAYRLNRAGSVPGSAQSNP